MGNEQFPHGPDIAAYLRKILRAFGGIEGPPQQEEVQVGGIGEVDPIATVYNECFTELDIMHDNLRRWLTEGTTLEELSDISEIHKDVGIPRNAGLMLHALIHHAVTEHDTSAVDRYVETLNLVPDAEDGSLADVYLFATLAGNERAAQGLHSRLAAEKERTAETILLDDPRDPSTSSTLFLARTVEACRNYGVSAEEWIGTYAADPLHQAYLDIRYLQGNTHTRGPAGILRARAEERVTQLVGLPNNVLAWLSPIMLKAVHDPVLRQKILWRYIEVLQTSPPISKSEIINLREVVAEVATTPKLLNQGTRDILARIVRLSGRSLQDTEFLSTDSSDNGAWRVDAAILDGQSPQQVAEDIYAQTISLFERLGKDLIPGSEEIAKAFVFERRNHILARCAVRYAKLGDFAAAKTLINDMSSSKRMQIALEVCLAYCRSPKDTDALQPDTWSPAHESDLNLQFKIKRAQQARDVTNLMRFGRDIGYEALADESVAEEITVDPMNPSYEKLVDELNAYKKMQQVVGIFETIMAHDKEKGIQLGRQLLTAARARNTPAAAFIIEYLSDELIRAGDAIETEFRANSVKNMTGNTYPADRLLHRLLLANLVLGFMSTATHDALTQDLRKRSGYPPSENLH